ncbi:MAG TPA: GntR family transcriptional regulator [Xanthobacteraceae bacterium]|nr:GntR family transcriptional regulator [Xanthobacteraceae bacterium]
MPPRSVVEEAYNSLKKSLVEGVYRPGQRLRALRVANELKISRTPVKEALIRLEQEGLLRREQGTGFIVRGLSVREILNLYRVREVLEVEAARQAFPRLTPAALTAMREALDDADALLAEGRHPDFLRASRRFHDLIAAQTGNSVLQEILANLGSRFWSIGTVVVSRHVQRATEIRGENHAILNALSGGDLKTVERAVKAHVKGAANAVRLFVESETQHLFIVAA